MNVSIIQPELNSITSINSAEIYYKQGNILHDQGKLEDAIESYIQALQLNPKFVGVYNNLGNVLKDLGRLEEAIESYKRALMIDPDYVEACYNMGIILTGIKFDLHEYNPSLTEIVCKILEKETIVRPADISYAAIEC